MKLVRRRDLAYVSRRAQVVARFVTGARAAPPEAEELIAAWEGHAAQVGIARTSPTYWHAGLRWIASQREPQTSTPAP